MSRRAVPALTVTRPQGVRLLGVADRTFARLEAEGVLVAAVKGTGRRGSSYDAYALVAGYLAHRERQLRGTVESSRDRRDRSTAELNELRLARERRAVLPRDQVVREGQAFVKAVMAKVRALPSRLVRAGVVAPAAEPTVAALLREAADEMSRWKPELDLLATLKEAGA
jgi:phage terminase Nu1 subunit (DNA packaging protein)